MLYITTHIIFFPQNPHVEGRLPALARGPWGNPERGSLRWHRPAGILCPPRGVAASGESQDERVCGMELRWRLLQTQHRDCWPANLWRLLQWRQSPRVIILPLPPDISNLLLLQLTFLLKFFRLQAYFKNL